MRRTLALLCTAAVGLTGVALGAPAAAAPAPQALGGATARGPVEAVPDELVVGYVAGASADQRARARGRAAARVAERVVAGAPGRREVELVRLPQGTDRDRAVAQLLSDPAVAYAEPNQVYRHQAKPGSGGSTVTTDAFSNGSLWGMYGDASTPANQFGSQAAEAWASGQHRLERASTSASSTRACRSTTPTSPANVWTNPFDPVNGVDNDGNGYVDDVHGWDFANGDSTDLRRRPDGSSTTTARTSPARSARSGGNGSRRRRRELERHDDRGKFLGRSGGTTANAVKAVDYLTDLKTRHGLEHRRDQQLVGRRRLLAGPARRDRPRRRRRHPVHRRGRQRRHGRQQRRHRELPVDYSTSATRLDCVIAVAAITSTGGSRRFSQLRRRRRVDLGAPGVGICSTAARQNGYGRPTAARRWRRRTSPARPRCTRRRTRRDRARRSRRRSSPRRCRRRRWPARRSPAGGWTPAGSDGG